MTSERDASPAEFAEWLLGIFPVAVSEADLKPFAGKPEEAAEFVYKQVEESYELKCSMENPEMLPNMERYVMLHCIDTEWQQYLRSMDELRDAVRLRAYGQRDPLVEYKREAFTLFEDLMARIKVTICTGVFRSSTSLESMQSFMAMARRPRRVQTTHAEVSVLGKPPADPQQQAQRDSDAFDKAIQRAEAATKNQPRPAEGVPAQPVERDAPKVGRNDPCPCGSGKKYKKCCGAES
jgi:preprotein translocase subunit SecA